MPKRKPRGQQADTINRIGDLSQHSFDLSKQDQFVTSLGIQFVHYKAMPSPIGLKDRGDYRRSDSLDTISSNGMLYTKAGCFTATMSDNSRSQSRSDGGILDPSTSRIIMPRYYDKNDAVAGGDRIYMAPGDRVYIADPNADVLVPNYQRMTYEPDQDNRPMFPIAKIEMVTDSRGVNYQEGVDFQITCAGDIRWLAGGSVPGIDPDTKGGRVYSVRYLYKAFFYVISIPKEIRMTNVTTGGVRAPERMPYHAVLQREYIYHQQINGGKTQPQEQKTGRTREEPQSGLDPASPQIKVNMDLFDEDS